MGQCSSQEIQVIDHSTLPLFFASRLKHLRVLENSHLEHARANASSKDYSHALKPVNLFCKGRTYSLQYDTLANRTREHSPTEITVFDLIVGQQTCCIFYKRSSIRRQFIVDKNGYFLCLKDYQQLLRQHFLRERLKGNTRTDDQIWSDLFDRRIEIIQKSTQRIRSLWQSVYFFPSVIYPNKSELEAKFIINPNFSRLDLFKQHHNGDVKVQESKTFREIWAKFSTVPFRFSQKFLNRRVIQQKAQSQDEQFLQFDIKVDQVRAWSSEQQRESGQLSEQGLRFLAQAKQLLQKNMKILRLVDQ